LINYDKTIGYYQLDGILLAITVRKKTFYWKLAFNVRLPRFVFRRNCRSDPEDMYSVMKTTCINKVVWRHIQGEVEQLITMPYLPLLMIGITTFG